MYKKPFKGVQMGYKTDKKRKKDKNRDLQTNKDTNEKRYTVEQRWTKVQTKEIFEQTEIC